MFDKFEYLVKLGNNNSDNYDHKYIEIKINLDHDLSLKKH